MADLLHLVPPDRVQGDALGGSVDGVSIGTGDDGGVVCALGASLDFEGVQARVHQLRHVVDHAHISAVHNIGALVVLKDREILARALFLHQVILIPAGLGAGTSAGIPSGHVVRQQTAAGVGHAHGAVDEGFDLQLRRSLLANFSDVLQGHLSRQDDPAGAQVVPGVGGLVVADAGLGGDVFLHVRGVLLSQPEGTQVGHDDGGDPGVVQHLQPSGQRLHLAAPGHGVDGHVGVHPVGFAVADSFI